MYPLSHPQIWLSIGHSHSFWLCIPYHHQMCYTKVRSLTEKCLQWTEPILADSWRMVIVVDSACGFHNEVFIKHEVLEVRCSYIACRSTYGTSWDIWISMAALKIWNPSADKLVWTVQINSRPSKGEHRLEGKVRSKWWQVIKGFAG